MYLISHFKCTSSGKHKEVPTCECGQNAICYACGYGRGSIPCKCSKPIILGVNSKGNIEWQVVEHTELKAQ